MLMIYKCLLSADYRHCQLIEMLMDHQFLNACAQMDVTDHVISVISTLIEPIDING